MPFENIQKGFKNRGYFCVISESFYKVIE